MLTPFEIQIFAERLALFDDQEALKRLFLHFNERLKRFSMAIVKNNEIAEEVTSDVFVMLWKYRARLTQIENLNSYLYTIAKNLCFKQLGKAKNINEFSLNDINLHLLPTIEKNPEESLLNNELIRHIESSIESLPPKCKLIYKLVRQDGLKYKEIASILNISVKTIDAQMAIASKRITQSIRFIFNAV